MASNALSPIVYQLQQGLRNVDLRSFTQDFDLQKFVNNIDLKTVGWLALAVVAVIFVIDLFIKAAGPLDSPYGSPVGSPFGRSLAISAANAWESNRDQLGLGNIGRGSRSLEPLTEVLDALAEAVKKWEEPQDKVLRNRSL